MGRVLDDAVALFRRFFWKMFPWALVGSLVVNASKILQQFVDPVTTTDQYLQGSQEPLVFAVSIGAMFVFQIFYAGMMLVLTREDGIERYRFEGNIVKRSILKGLVLVIPLTLYVLAIMLGSMALLIPGVILMLSLMLYAPLVVLENTGPLRALSDSHKLIWGNWWRTMLILSIPMLIMMAGLVSIGLIWGGALFFTDSLNANAGLIMDFTLSVVVGTFVTPFFVTTMITCMNDLQLRRDGTDLEERLDGAVHA